MAAGRGLEGSGARGTRGGCHEADGRVGEAEPLGSAALGWGEKAAGACFEGLHGLRIFVLVKKNAISAGVFGAGRGRAAVWWDLLWYPAAACQL